MVPCHGLGRLDFEHEPAVFFDQRWLVYVVLPLVAQISDAAVGRRHLFQHDFRARHEQFAQGAAHGILLACLVPKIAGVPFLHHLRRVDPSAPHAFALKQRRLLAKRLGGRKVPGIEPAVRKVGAAPVDQGLQQVGAEGKSALAQDLGKGLFLVRDGHAGPHPFGR